MSPELTNLLPEERMRELRRDYFYRLGAVIAVLLSVLVIVHAIFLFPTYEYLGQQIAERTEQLNGLKSTLSASDAKTLSSQVAALSSQSITLSALGKVNEQVPFLTEVLSVPHGGITFSNISFTPAPGESETVSLTGTALTRDSLRSYDLALSAAPFISSVNLPVSAYASESDIAFTLTLTRMLPSP